MLKRGWGGYAGGLPLRGGDRLVVISGCRVARLLIGSVYYLRLDPKRFEEMQPFPPLATLCAAAYVRAHGHDVHFFDAMLANSDAEWTSMAERVRPDIAVLYDDNFNYLSKMCLTNMRDAAVAMIAAAKGVGREGRRVLFGRRRSSRALSRCRSGCGHPRRRRCRARRDRRTASAVRASATSRVLRCAVPMVRSCARTGVRPCAISMRFRSRRGISSTSTAIAASGASATACSRSTWRRRAAVPIRAIGAPSRSGDRATRCAAPPMSWPS